MRGDPGVSVISPGCRLVTPSESGPPAARPWQDSEAQVVASPRHGSSQLTFHLARVPSKIGLKIDHY